MKRRGFLKKSIAVLPAMALAPAALSLIPEAPAISPAFYPVMDAVAGLSHAMDELAFNSDVWVMIEQADVYEPKRVAWKKVNIGFSQEVEYTGILSMKEL